MCKKLFQSILGGAPKQTPVQQNAAPITTTGEDRTDDAVVKNAPTAREGSGRVRLGRKSNTQNSVSLGLGM